MIYRVIIWGAGGGYNRCFNNIKRLEENAEIEVVGIIADSLTGKECLDGFFVYEKNSVASLCFDYCIVTVEKYDLVLPEAMDLGIPREKMIPARVLGIPYFRFEDYIGLKTSGLSIISINCFGGICYHYLALEFLSPTINLFFVDSEFNRFIENMDYYLSLPIRFDEMRYERNLKRDYPVGLLDDIHIHFNHATSFDDAVIDWERRKNRLVDKRLYVSCTTNKDEALRFSGLPLCNKIIFVPKGMEIKADSVFAVNYNDKSGSRSIGMYINDFANGRYSELSVFRLCCNRHYDRTIVR